MKYVLFTVLSFVCLEAFAQVDQSNDDTKLLEDLKNLEQKSQDIKPHEQIKESLIKDDVITLWKAKISEDVILTFINHKKKTFELSAQDVVEMTKEGVSDKIIKELLTYKEKLQIETLKSYRADMQDQELARKTPIVTRIPLDGFFLYPNIEYGYHNYYRHCMQHYYFHKSCCEHRY